MGTTFQGQGPVRTARGGAERVSLLDTFVLKLRAVGAQDDEIEGVRTAWAASPPEPDEVEWMRLATDAELLHALRQTRVENLDADASTTFGGGEPESEGATAEGSPPSSPETIPSDVETVPQVIDWVGGDVDRALVALDVEQQRPSPRVTLVEALEALLNAATE